MKVRVVLRQPRAIQVSVVGLSVLFVDCPSSCGLSFCIASCSHHHQRTSFPRVITFTSGSTQWTVSQSLDTVGGTLFRRAERGSNHVVVDIMLDNLRAGTTSQYDP